MFSSYYNTKKEKQTNVGNHATAIIDVIITILTTWYIRTRIRQWNNEPGKRNKNTKLHLSLWPNYLNTNSQEKNKLCGINKHCC